MGACKSSNQIIFDLEEGALTLKIQNYNLQQVNRNLSELTKLLSEAQNQGNRYNDLSAQIGQDNQNNFQQSNRENQLKDQLQAQQNEEILQGYKFSQTLKHIQIVLSNDFKKAKSQAFSEFYCCLFDQPIKKENAAVRFKILQCNWINLGICLIESIKKDFQFKNWMQNGNGYYFLCSNKCLWSHHNNLKFRNPGISYGVNDIVTVVVNQQLKQITWKVKDEQCSLEIQTTSDLYFCCCMTGANEVEII